jgi:hypothetical protein
MSSFGEKTCDALLPSEALLTGGNLSEQLSAAEDLVAVEGRLAKREMGSACHDYSEEAIAERDPAYRLPYGTDHEEQTIEAVSAEVRLDLARLLEKLGMSRARAAALASL